MIVHCNIYVAMQWNPLDSLDYPPKTPSQIGGAAAA
jgi:hypothetical protein